MTVSPEQQWEVYVPSPHQPALVKRKASNSAALHVRTKCCLLPHTNGILKIQQAEDESSVKPASNYSTEIKSCIQKKNPVSSRDFCSHLCHFGKAGSCDDIYCFGIIPGTKQNIKFGNFKSSSEN